MPNTLSTKSSFFQSESLGSSIYYVTKSSKKLNFLPPERIHTCEYPGRGAWNLSFPENVAYVLNGWSFMTIRLIKSLPYRSSHQTCSIIKGAFRNFWHRCFFGGFFRNFSEHLFVQTWQLRRLLLESVPSILQKIPVRPLAWFQV